MRGHRKPPRWRSRAVFLSGRKSKWNSFLFEWRGRFRDTESEYWFGGRLEFNAYSGNDAGTVVTAQTITYGPVFSYRRFSRITPFAHLQLGAQHASKGYLGISESASKFAIAPGGGFDLALNRRTALRVDGEYLITQFLGLTQQNASVSLGVVVRFGKR